MKKVVITGASSMIGFALVQQCIKNKIFVYGVIRKHCAKINEFPLSPYLKIVECGLDEIENLATIIGESIDVFYHIAWTHTDKDGRLNAVLQNENIKYTLDAVNVAKKLNCTTFVGAGSQSEFGKVETLISPDTPTNPEFAYGVAKYCAGKLSKEQCTSLGIAHIWVRIFSVYGILDAPHTMIRYVIDALLEGVSPKLTKCEQMWDYLYVEDCARAFLLIGQNPINGVVYCLGSGIAKPLHEYVSIIKDTINPNIAIDFGAKEYGENQPMYLCADISSLTKDTGFLPKTSFEEGIKETLRWIKGIKQ